MSPASCACNQQAVHVASGFGAKAGMEGCPSLLRGMQPMPASCVFSTPSAPLLCRPAGVQDWTHGWRLSLGLAAVPALVLLAGGILLPESPNSLIER